MTGFLTEFEILKELEPVVTENIDRHFAQAKDWNPHDYIPWKEGKNFLALGGQDWDPEQSELSEVAKAALITNLLTEDNLPSYHRELAESFKLDQPWGAWVGRWTSEENKHSIAIRDYLVVTRGVDPVQLELDRMVQMTHGFTSRALFSQNDQRNEPEMEILYTTVYVTFQELATRVSHRNTARICGDPIAEKLLSRISTDENLHMLFYRNVGKAALEVAPNQVMKAVMGVLVNFIMPGAQMPNFRRNGVLMAKHGVYDLNQHLNEVVWPVLRKWQIFERTDIHGQADFFREILAKHLEDLKIKAVRFEESRQRALARDLERAS